MRVVKAEYVWIFLIYVINGALLISLSTFDGFSGEIVMIGLFLFKQKYKKKHQCSINN